MVESTDDKSNEVKLHATTDAAEWAREFLRIWGGHVVDGHTIDFGLMVSWFANAIEVGRTAGSAPSATLQKWTPWDGTYEKQFYDVRYDRCKVQLHCWPNDGKMVAVDGSGLEWAREDAVEVRVSEFQNLPPSLSDIAPPAPVESTGYVGLPEKTNGKA